MEGHRWGAERRALVQSASILDLPPPHLQLSVELHVTLGCVCTVAADPGVSTATETLITLGVCALSAGPVALCMHQ